MESSNQAVYPPAPPNLEIQRIADRLFGPDWTERYLVEIGRLQGELEARWSDARAVYEQEAGDA